MVVYISRDPSYALEHHGIKGMKWGVRRFQNKDGSLTAAGKKRYDVGDATVLDKKAAKAFNQGKRGLGHFYKKQARNERIAKKIQYDSNISSRRKKLEERYKAEGYSDKEAAVAAYKRERAEKAAVVAGSIALTAAAVVVARKVYQDRVDQVIKSGTVWKRVTSNERAELHDAFYAATKKKDTDRYVGLYAGGQRLGALGRGHMFQVSIKNTEDLKVVSPHKARKELQSLAQDPEFRKKASETVGRFDRIAAINIANGKIGKTEYEQFNRALVDHNSPAVKSFYKALRSKGYDAIGDINDRKYSGYNAKSATIIFNKTKAAVIKSRELGRQEMAAQLAKHRNAVFEEQTVKELGRGVAKYGSVYGGFGAAAIAGAKALDARIERETVYKYKKQHPNTKLSRAEIIERYYQRSGT